MLTPGFSLFLAVLRIAAGVSLFPSGLHKPSWFAQPPLQQKFAEWSAHPANDAVAKYLAFVSQYPAVFSRVVVVGELGLGALLILGLLTPLAALLAFVMVLNFQFASGRSEEHTSELQSRLHLVCRLLLEKKKNKKKS